MSVAAVTGLGSSLFNAVINKMNTDNTNMMNQAINEQNLEYNKEMTLKSWERDDNAHQREVADLEAAGLSPLASMNGASVSSPLGAPSPIAMQAPQIDLNGILDGVIAGEKLKENIRSNKANEDLRLKEIKNTVTELELKSRNLDIQDKDVKSQIEYRVSLAKNESLRIEEMTRSNKKNEKLRSREIDLSEAEYESKKYYEEIKHQTGGENVPYKVYDNWDDYLSARQTYLDALNRLIDDYLNNPTKFAHNVNNHGGGSIGSSSVGSFGLNYGEGESKYTDISDAAKAEWFKFQQKYPVPVFIHK